MVKKIFFTLLLFGAVSIASTVEAATLQFEPTSFTVNSGQEFDVAVKAVLGSDSVTSVDAYVLYDKDLVEATKVTNGTFFPTVLNSLTNAGRAYVAGMVDDPASSKTGTGTLATLTFKAKAKGAVTLRFDCTQGATNESNINKNDVNATDIIVCTNNGQATATVDGGAAAATGAPTPTTVTQLPQSGIMDNKNVVIYAAIGSLLFLIGLGLKVKL
jgi:hypothetical protein